MAPVLGSVRRGGGDALTQINEWFFADVADAAKKIKQEDGLGVVGKGIPEDMLVDGRRNDEEGPSLGKIWKMGIPGKGSDDCGRGGGWG